MPWGGERWLEGLWEASYAHYRIGDYEKTLGNLLTLQSPYFKDEYFPESYVLKAIVYYENCRYPEARRVLETFSRLTSRSTTSSRGITGGRAHTRRVLSSCRRRIASGGAITRKIMKLAYTDQNVRRLAESIGEIEDEMDRGHRRPPPGVPAVGAREAARRRARGREARRWSRRPARAPAASSSTSATSSATLLAQALRIQIEVSRKEREALEGSLAKGSQVEVVRDLKYSTAVSDEHLYWPYEGEFWRDELGTYSYTLTKGCKDRLPAARRRGPVAA